MRKFKFFDFWISVILIVCSIIFVIIFPELPAFITYFFIGAWQCISMVMHYSKRWFVEESSIRRLFHQTVISIFFLVLSGTVIGFFTNSLIFLLAIFMILYVATPILAITYTCICYNETYVKMRRPLSLLK